MEQLFCARARAFWFPQATAVWNRVEFLRTNSSRPLLFLNLDETGVPLFQGDRAGTVRRPKRKHIVEGRAMEPTPFTTRRETRAQATHVDVICDDASVQPLLPQILVGDPTTLPATVCRRLQSDMLANVRLLRLKSRWTDGVLMAAIIRSVAASVRDACAAKQPVPLLDTAPSHLDAWLPRLARRLGVELVLVPARTTWLLQPCDTDVFLRYKAVFRTMCLREELSTADGRITPDCFWRMLINHVHVFMSSRCWDFAFRRTGYSARALGVGSFVRTALPLPPSWTLDQPHVPTEVDLGTALPANRTAPLAAWIPR
jgi:hypothetical protein